MQRSVCVYCGSRMGHNPMHQQTARDLGRAMAQRNWQLIYGGGTVGLMGVLARSVLEYGGDVLGIIPQALYDREIALRESTRLIVTETMSQRRI
ncbi:MAG: hypothetical protein HC837_10315 [Chloroflexaceae bacterium]|nr:hypothetical protein [Chloroflexaceae bacterium]